MFAVKRESAVERRLGQDSRGQKEAWLRKAGSGARDDGWSDSYPRVGYCLPCLRLGAFLGL